MRSVSVFACVVCLGLGLLDRPDVFAQSQGSGSENESSESEGTAGFWEIEVASMTTDTEGITKNRFTARLDHISSVSQHDYVIDGTVKVYECTVDTTGGMTARFYYIEPVTAGSSVSAGSAAYNQLRNVANKVTKKTSGMDMDVIVTKNYPTTTHAKTAEYRLKYKDTISKIYEHAHRVWAEERGRGKGNKLTIRE